MIAPLLDEAIDSLPEAERSLVLLRFFEVGGEIRQAVSVVKKRGSSHQRTIRDFTFADGAIKVGTALSAFRGVLTGVPWREAPDLSSTKQP